MPESVGRLLPAGETPPSPPPPVKIVTGERGRRDMSQSPAAVPAGVERLSPAVLVVTHRLEPIPTGAVRLQLSGRRLGGGRPQPGDRFQMETTVHVPAASGPVSVTSTIAGMNPGKWDITVRPLDNEHLLLYAVDWSWWRWRLLKRPARPVRTHPALLSFSPGLLPRAWRKAFALLGVIVALAVQSLSTARLGVDVDEPLTVSLPAIAAGGVGGKLWYLAVCGKQGQRHRPVVEGWAVQGFMVGANLAALALLAYQGADIGGFFDATAPALLFGMSIGSLGCFFTGCCAGRATRFSFGIWSSDRHLGMRRVPTQLLESALALMAGLGTLGALTLVGLVGGALFVAAAALYFLIRQALLRFRAERPRNRLGNGLIVLLIGVILVLDALYVAVSEV